MVRPWNEWLIVWGYDIAGPPPSRRRGGRHADRPQPARPARPRASRSPAPRCGATTRCTRRTCSPGACSAWATPSTGTRRRNGLGSNTSIQDSYNLAWKLAAVLRGQAGPALLDSYTAERAPVAEQIVTRANQSSARVRRRSSRPSGSPRRDRGARWPPRSRSARPNTPAGAAKRGRAASRPWSSRTTSSTPTASSSASVYASGAVVPDGTARPAPTRDPELYYEPSTAPGAHLPHAWVGDACRKVSTLDLAAVRPVHPAHRHRRGGLGGRGGAGGGRARRPLQPVVIGPGRRVTDLYDDWARLREVEEDGALLVRPDKHVAWRAHSLPEDPHGALHDALARVLGRGEDGGAR